MVYIFAAEYVVCAQNRWREKVWGLLGVLKARKRGHGVGRAVLV